MFTTAIERSLRKLNPDLSLDLPALDIIEEEIEELLNNIYGELSSKKSLINIESLLRKIKDKYQYPSALNVDVLIREIHENSVPRTIKLEDAIDVIKNIDRNYSQVDNTNVIPPLIVPNWARKYGISKIHRSATEYISYFLSYIIHNILEEAEMVAKYKGRQIIIKEDVLEILNNVLSY